MSESIAIRLASTRGLNTIFNGILLVLIGVALWLLTEPLKAITGGFLKLENLEVLILFIGVLFVVNIYQQVGGVADAFLYWTRWIRNSRVSLIFTSLILAILPIKGRTIVSAPIIGQIAQKHKLSKFNAAMVDFMATHIMYLILPFEGSVVVVLTTFALIGYGLGTFISYMLPGILFIIIVVAYHSYKSGVQENLKVSTATVTFGHAFKVAFPVILLMVAAGFFELMEIKYSLLLGTAIFVGLTLVMLQPTLQQIKAAIKGMDKQLIVTLMLIFLFAAVAKDIPVVKAFAGTIFTSAYTIPLLIIGSYTIGFVIGSSGTVATIIFGLLAPLIVNLPNAFQLITIAYASLYAGYLTSPAHACCHYAASYFDMPYLKVWLRGTLYGLCTAGLIIVVALFR